MLPQLPFPDASFDATVANFVINHVGDPAKTVTELRRVLRRGGHVAATIWPHPQPPMQQLWGQIFDAAGAQRPATTPAVAADKDFERTTDGFTRLLRDVKFTDVRCQTIIWTHHTDPEEWWSGPANGIGNLGLLMETQPPAMIDRIKQEYDRLTAAYLTKDGVLALPTGALLASGRAT